MCSQAVEAYNAILAKEWDGAWSFKGMDESSQEKKSRCAQFLPAAQIPAFKEHTTWARTWDTATMMRWGLTLAVTCWDPAVLDHSVLAPGTSDSVTGAPGVCGAAGLPSALLVLTSGQRKRSARPSLPQRLLQPLGPDPRPSQPPFLRLS